MVHVAKRCPSPPLLEGMAVTTLPDAEVAKQREMTKPVWVKFTKQFGRDSAATMMADLKK